MSLANKKRFTIIFLTRDEENLIDAIRQIFEIRTILELDPEILVGDDGSTIHKPDEQNLSKKFNPLRVRVITNNGQMNFNKFVGKLLSEVTSEYLHLRSPHDFYSMQFYIHHCDIIKRLAPNMSYSAVATEQKKPINIKPVAAGSIETKSSCCRTILDLNLSSCSFVANSEKFKLVWNKYIETEDLCDFLCKKELYYGPNVVGFSGILSVYWAHRPDYMISVHPFKNSDYLALAGHLIYLYREYGFFAVPILPLKNLIELERIIFVQFRYNIVFLCAYIFSRIRAKLKVYKREKFR